MLCRPGVVRILTLALFLVRARNPSSVVSARACRSEVLVRSMVVACLVFIGLALAAPPAAGQSTGRFEGQLVVEWLENESGPDRDMRLVEPFAFHDGRGYEWPVPVGAVVNGASIPRLLWPALGSPFVGDYRRASVVHDHFCTLKNRRWQAVHRMFYDALLASGVPGPRALILYGAVFAGGPRWSGVAGIEPGGPELRAVWPELSEDDFRELEAWIRTNEPTVEAVESEAQRLITR